MPGRVTSSSDDRAQVALDTGVEVSAERNGLATGERCHAVVRPEKLRIGRAGEPMPEGWRAVKGTVQSSVFLGTSTQIVVELPGDVRMTVLVPNADERERARLPGGGAPVSLGWAPEHVHLVRDSANGGPPPAPERASDTEQSIAQGGSG